jgi:FkbM family methyltransferase
LFVKGYQENAEIEAAMAWLRPGESCIDVGANVGWLSAAFASAVGPQGRVLSLEPSPGSFAFLVGALRILGLRHVVPIACCASNDDGVTSFYVADGKRAGAEEESMQIGADRSGEFRQMLVPKAKLATLCGAMDAFSRPALIKVDVEGAEPLVLSGASPLLDCDNPPLVICEIHRTALGNYDFTPADVLKHLPANRFDLYFIPRSISDQTADRRHGRVYALRDPAQLPIYSNLLALPCSGHDACRHAAVRTVLDAHSGP